MKDRNPETLLDEVRQWHETIFDQHLCHFSGIRVSGYVKRGPILGITGGWVGAVRQQDLSRNGII